MMTQIVFRTALAGILAAGALSACKSDRAETRREAATLDREEQETREIERNRAEGTAFSPGFSVAPNSGPVADSRREAAGDGPSLGTALVKTGATSKLVVDVEGADAGKYSVVLYPAQDCETLEKADDDSAELSSGQVLGSVDVTAAGSGRLETTLDAAKLREGGARGEQAVVALREIEADEDEPELDDVIACRSVAVSLADQEG